MAVAQQLRIDLTRGYLFHPTTPQGGILDAPFTSTAAEARLKGYLKEMGSDDGETIHGFRAGCAITLALSGAELSEIMDHVGVDTTTYCFTLLAIGQSSQPAGSIGSIIGSRQSSCLG